MTARKTNPLRTTRPFASGELVLIRALVDAGYSKSRVAKAMGRSPGCIRGTCSYYKITAGPNCARGRRR